jgi:phage gp46-like protein
MRSETANALRSLPAVSSNLGRLEQAASRDLEWFTKDGFAQKVEVSAMLTSVNEVTIRVRILIDNEEFVSAFFSIWGN